MAKLYELVAAHADFFAALASILAILAALAGVIRLMNKKPNEFLLYPSEKVIIPNKLTRSFDVNVSDGKKHLRGLSFSITCIANRLGRTVTSTDFTIPLGIDDPHDTIFWLETILEDSTLKGDSKKIGERHTLQDLNIPNDKAIFLVVAHDGSQKRELDASLRDSPDISTDSTTAKDWNTILSGVIYLLIASALLSSILYSFLFSNDHSRGGIIVLAVMFILSFSVAILTGREAWRAIRWKQKASPAEKKFQDRDTIVALIDKAISQRNS